MVRKNNNGAPDDDSDFGDLGAGAIFVVAVLLLFAVGVVLFLGSSQVIAGVASNPVFAIVTSKAEIPDSIPTPRSRIDPASLTPTPGPQPTPTFTPSFVRIANTGGDGVYIRRTPRSADKLAPWMDGTVLEVVGPDREAEGIVWRNVKDPKGNVGWIPTQYIEAN